MMAQAGISGPKRLLNGENGFFNLYAPDEPDLKQLIHQLGIAFLGEEATCFKLYPHCSILLALTDTLLNPETRHQLSTDPAKIILYASPAMYMVCGAQYQPQKTAEIDAQFSARYIIANALLRGQASAREFSAAFATEPTVVELAQRIEVYEQASLERFDHFKLHITSEQGDTLRLESRFGRGWPENPADMQDIREKFLHCCFQSPCRAMKLNVQHLLSCIGSLVEAPSLHELLAITSEPQ